MPPDHPLRAIPGLVDQILATMSKRFDKMYAENGRPSMATERLLQALLLPMFYPIRCERMLMEQLFWSEEVTRARQVTTAVNWQACKHLGSGRAGCFLGHLHSQRRSLLPIAVGVCFRNSRVLSRSPVCVAWRTASITPSDTPGHKLFCRLAQSQAAGWAPQESTSTSRSTAAVSRRDNSVSCALPPSSESAPDGRSVLETSGACPAAR
jgi:hypothetical protein